MPRSLRKCRLVTNAVATRNGQADHHGGRHGWGIWSGREGRARPPACRSVLSPTAGEAFLRIEDEVMCSERDCRSAGQWTREAGVRTVTSGHPKKNGIC